MRTALRTAPCVHRPLPVARQEQQPTYNLLPQQTIMSTKTSRRQRTLSVLMLWAQSISLYSNIDGFQIHTRHTFEHSARRYTRLHAIRRPIRPASNEKKIAERKALIETRQNEALQDPTLLSDQLFSECNNLHSSTKRSLVEDMGLQRMTEVQAKTYNAAIKGRDVLARARTGTG